MNRYEVIQELKVLHDKEVEYLEQFEVMSYSKIKVVLSEAVRLLEERYNSTTDKERLISFIEKTIPDDFVCNQFSFGFKDDNTAILTMDNSHTNESDAVVE
jgi:hypothetical protein